MASLLSFSMKLTNLSNLCSMAPIIENIAEVFFYQLFLFFSKISIEVKGDEYKNKYVMLLSSITEINHSSLMVIFQSFFFQRCFKMKNPLKSVVSSKAILCFVFLSR